MSKTTKAIKTVLRIEPRAVYPNGLKPVNGYVFHFDQKPKGYLNFSFQICEQEPTKRGPKTPSWKICSLTYLNFHNTEQVEVDTGVLVPVKSFEDVMAEARVLLSRYNGQYKEQADLAFDLLCQITGD